MKIQHCIYLAFLHSSLHNYLSCIYDFNGNISITLPALNRRMISEQYSIWTEGLMSGIVMEFARTKWLKQWKAHHCSWTLGHWLQASQLWSQSANHTQHSYRSPSEDIIAPPMATPSGSNVIGGKQAYILAVTEHTTESGSWISFRDTSVLTRFFSICELSNVRSYHI